MMMISKVQILFLLIIGFRLITGKKIPEPGQAAKMARYVIRTVDWVSIATTSTQINFLGYAFANLKSISDGPSNNSTGLPYFYMSNMDFTGQDLSQNNNCSIMATLAETNYCNAKDWDPQDPRCVRVIMTGKIVKVNNDTHEYVFAKNALFGRHPEMKMWPLDHQFYVGRMNIEFIGVLDVFGGIRHVSVEDYFDVKSNYLVQINERINDVFIIVADED